MSDGPITRDTERTRFEALAKDAYEARVETFVMLARIEEQFKAHKEDDSKNFTAITQEIKELKDVKTQVNADVAYRSGEQKGRGDIIAKVMAGAAFIGFCIELLVNWVKK